MKKKFKIIDAFTGGNGVKLFKYIPHKCWYKVTGNNGLTHTPCEKTCILCGESIHLPWDGFLKDGAKWLDGKFPWGTK